MTHSYPCAGRETSATEPPSARRGSGGEGTWRSVRSTRSSCQDASAARLSSAVRGREQGSPGQQLPHAVCSQRRDSGQVPTLLRVWPQEPLLPALLGSVSSPPRPDRAGLQHALPADATAGEQRHSRGPAAGWPTTPSARGPRPLCRTASRAATASIHPSPNDLVKSERGRFPNQQMSDQDRGSGEVSVPDAQNQDCLLIGRRTPQVRVN